MRQDTRMGWLWIGLLIIFAEAVTAFDELETLKRLRSDDLAALDEIAQSEPSIAIPILAGYAAQGDMFTLEPELVPARDRAIELLVQIPGHAEYLVKRMEESRGTQDYDQRQLKTFRVLRRLKSEETIAVLARYLSDRRDFPSLEELIEYTDSAPPPWNSLLAAESLAWMKLEDAPSQKRWDLYGEGDVQVWKDWAIRKGYELGDFQVTPVAADDGSQLHPPNQGSGVPANLERVADRPGIFKPLVLFIGGFAPCTRDLGRAKITEMKPQANQ